MLYALFLDAANPGSFQDELNEMFERNNLPKIKITKSPPSNVILGLQNIEKKKEGKGTEEGKEKEKTTTTITTDTTKSKEEKKSLEKEKEEPKTTRQSKQKEKEKPDSEEEMDNDMPELEQLPAEAVGLKLIAKKKALAGHPISHSKK